MPDPAHVAAEIVEALTLKLRRLSGTGRYQELRAYFEPGEPRPPSPAFFRAMEAINQDLPAWLDPGPVTAPPSAAVEEEEDDVLRFPSVLPGGDPDLDRVALKVYPRPAAGPDTGILFHHWLFMNGWLAVDWLLAPLVERLPVAAMVAPHHFLRRTPGMRSGEGMVNLNPRHMFRGLRQWQADHLASIALLARDHGFQRVVVFGDSLGAYCTMLHRLIRPPLPTVALCCTNHFARGIFEGAHTRDFARALLDSGFTRESFARATRSLHLSRWADSIRSDGLSWLYASDDQIEPQDSLEELRKALDCERVVSLEGGHATALIHRGRIVEEVLRRAGLDPEGAYPPDQAAGR